MPGRSEALASAVVDAPTTTAPTTASDEQSEPVAALDSIRIHGRVVDDVGRGVAGAKVEIRAWSGAEPDVRWFTTRTGADAAGFFEKLVDTERATMGFGVETSADGFVEGWRAVKPDEYDPSQGIEVVMEPARAISGRVIDADARPIPGTAVQLWYGSESTWPTTVDEDGRFRTPSRAPRRALELVVEAPGFARRLIPIAAADEDIHDVGEIVFHRGGQVSGVVVDVDGRPLGDIPLELAVVTTRTASAPTCRSDSAGRFAFDGLGGDVVTISVDGSQRGGPPGAWRYFRGSATDVETGRTDVRIVARASATLTLRFVDPATNALVDLRRATYGLRLEGTPEPERLGQGASSSGALTSTTLSAECGRRYDVTVRAAGFEDGHVNGIDVGDVAKMTINVPMRRAN